MTIKTEQLAGIFTEGYSFADLLPYDEYFEGVFIHRDGSLGKIMEVGTIDCELKNENELLSISDQLELVLQRIPENNTSCQLILFNDSFISEKLEAYMRQTLETSSDIVQEFAFQKSQFIYTSRDGFFNNELNFSPKRIRVFFTMRYFPQWVHPSIIDKFKSLFWIKRSQNDQILMEFAKHKGEIDRISERIANTFKSSGCNVRDVDDKEFIAMMYRLLNPRRSNYIETPNIDSQEPIRDQVLYNAPYYSPAGFSFEGYQSRVVTVKNLPNETSPGMFTLEAAFGNNECLLDIIKNFMIVINISIPDQGSSLTNIKLQKTLSFIHSVDNFGDSNVEAEEKKQDYDDTIKELFSGGQKLVMPRIHFVMFDTDNQKVEKACDQLLLSLNRIGCEGVKEDIIGASLFLTCLPLNFDHYYDKTIRREKRVCSKNLSDMFPCYGSFQGTKTPAQMYLTRRGESVFFDPFDSQTNAHNTLIGSSGSGKSFFVVDMICQQARLDGYFFVLDKGDSYKKACQTLNGQYVTFDLNDPMTINPFYRKPDPENVAFLVNMISQMASGGDDRDRLTREDEGFIQKAIQSAYEQHWGKKEIFLSDVVELLKDKAFNQENGLGELMGKKIALKLEPFIGKGAFGKFFDGPNQFDFTNRFTVFELANLSSHEDLQLVVLLNIMYFITNFVSSPEMKPKRKFLFIDEAWSLLKLKNTAEFITNAFKTFRKHRCSVTAITQELSDLVKQESGTAILANTANKIILKQEISVLQMFQEGMGMPDKTVQVLKSLRTIKGKYSEALLITDSFKGVVRLISNPFLFWLANTEPANNAYLEKIFAERKNLVQALNQCAKEYPYGV